MNCDVYTYFIYFGKAFDKVHEKLIKIMTSGNLYLHQTARVKVEDDLSQVFSKKMSSSKIHTI